MNPKKRALFWIWLMMVVAYLDRQNLSIAGPTIMKALHTGPVHFGFVLSAFTLGYALMQVPGGWLADRFGARRLLVTALVIWSAFTALTGFARSVTSLIAIRILFGVGEGIENGAQFKLIGDYFDSRERSSANALFLTALAVGPALTAPAASWLLLRVGWRELFLCFAALGLVVAVLLAVFLPKPSGDVVHTEVFVRDDDRSGWKVVLDRRTSWLAFAGYLFFNVAFWGFLGWMPTYLNQTRHIDLKALGYAASIPYICGFFGMLAMGYLGTHTLFKHRASMVAACYLLAAVFLFATFHAAHVAPCLALLSAAAFFLYGGFGPFWAIALDLTPDDMRGAFTGFVNLGGQIGGFFAPIVVGEIVKATRSFTGGFVFMMTALMFAAVSLLWLQRAGRQVT